MCLYNQKIAIPHMEIETSYQFPIENETMGEPTQNM